VVAAVSAWDRFIGRHCIRVRSPDRRSALGCRRIRISGGSMPGDGVARRAIGRRDRWGGGGRRVQLRAGVLSPGR
jgi:hypothetical protein